MEGFNEQVVKRVNKAKQLVIKIISVVVLIMIPFIGAGLAIMYLRRMVRFLAAEGRV